MEGVAVNDDSFLGQKNPIFVAQGHLHIIGICKASTSLDRKIFYANEKNMNAHEIYEKQTRQSKHCGFCINIFIGPESDHWLCLSVTD